MKLTEHQITEARNVYNLYWDSYLAGDVDAFASMLDENYEMIGTSEGEIAHNKADGIAFFKSQMQEMAGKAEMRNRQISAKPVNEMLLINENCDIFVLAGTVSIEMVDEVRQEISSISVETRYATEKGHTAQTVETRHALSLQTISEILADIKSNLTKIHEHGTRADGIVKSMLMHSCGGSGKMEPTDLNALVKEYVNLAFHGMRAGKNPINADIQLDLDDSFGKIALIEEDFSRVILNLCNNAFDAMREKTKTDPGYKPILSMSTKQKEKAVEIAISDNGPGIPEEIKDKILQPFFTTKKGTEGTGLGLSITHDIVKAHGGKLNISSSPGGTIFKILLNK